MGCDWYSFQSIIACGVFIPRSLLTHDYTVPEGVSVLEVSVYGEDRNEGHVPFIFPYIPTTYKSFKPTEVPGPYVIEDNVVDVFPMKHFSNVVTEEDKETLRKVYFGFTKQNVQDDQIGYHLINSTDHYLTQCSDKFKWEALTLAEEISWIPKTKA